MGSDRVVHDSPVLDDDLRLEEGGEHLTARTSSRTRLPNDSTNGFSHGDPGSMEKVLEPLVRHQSRIAFAVISGPLSILMNVGAPRRAMSRSSTATT